MKSYSDNIVDTKKLEDIMEDNRDILTYQIKLNRKILWVILGASLLNGLGLLMTLCEMFGIFSITMFLHS